MIIMPQYKTEMKDLAVACIPFNRVIFLTRDQVTS